MQHHRRDGFTLIELLIFVAIFGLIIGAFITILVGMVSVQSSQSVQAEVQQQGQFLEQQIQYYVQSARLVDMPVDTAESKLTVRESATSTDPTIIYAPGFGTFSQNCFSTTYDVTSTSCTFSSSVTAGDLIVAWGDQEPGTPIIATSSISSTCGLSWTTVYATSSGAVGIWSASAPSTGACTATYTVSQATSSANVSLNIGDFTGVQNQLDGSAVTTTFVTGTPWPVTTPIITTSQPNDFILTSWMHYQGSATATPSDVTSPFTMQWLPYTSAGFGTLVAGYQQPYAGPISATLNNYPNFHSGYKPINIMAFKASTTGSSTAGTVYLEQGTSAATALTSNRVTVSNLSFTRHYNLNSLSSAYGSDSVSYSFTVTAKQGSSQYSQTFSSSATVGAPIGKIALVRQGKAENNSASVSSLAAQYPTANDVGDLLLAVVAYRGSATSNVTDSAGNSWTLIGTTSFAGVAGTEAIYEALNSLAATNTTTATLSGSASYGSLYIYEYRGASASSSADTGSSQTQINTTAPTSPAVTASSTVELLFGLVENTTPNTATFTPGSGYTLETSSTAGNTTQIFIEDMDQDVTSAVTAPWTSSPATTSTASIATFM